MSSGVGSGTRFYGRWMYVVVPLFLFWVISTIDKLGISVIVTSHVFQADMGIAGKSAAIGFIGTAFALAYGVANVGWGFVVDRIGPRAAAIIAACIWGLMMIMGGLSDSYGTLLWSRVILGLGEGALWSVSNKLTGNWFPSSERGRAQSRWYWGSPFGPVIGTPLVTAILVSSGWHAAFYVVGIISLVVMIPVLVFLTRDTPSKHPWVSPEEREYIEAGRRSYIVQSEERHTTTLRFAIGNWRYWFLIVAFLMAGVMYYGVGFWLPTYLEQASHFSTGSMAVWTSLAWVLDVVVMLLCGYLADRMQRPALMGGIVFVIAVVAMTIASLTPNPALAAVLVALGPTIAGATSLLCNPVLPRFAGPTILGSAAGIMTGIGTLLGGLAPTVIGALVGASGGSFVTALYFLVGCAVVGAVAFFVQGDPVIASASVPAVSHGT